MVMADLLLTARGVRSTCEKAWNPLQCRSQASCAFPDVFVWEGGFTMVTTSQQQSAPGENSH